MRRAIERVEQGKHLSFDEMKDVSVQLFDEETDSSDIQTFLVGLAEKGETAQEVAALASVMKSFATPYASSVSGLMDNCGTGGDGANTFNISTTVAFVLAAAGVKVAKHGNRKISSQSGSSDVLEALGIRLDLTPEQSAQLLKEQGLAFLFAPNVHPKMKRIGAVRQAIQKPTIFNLVGPLTNPLALESQLAGISRTDFIMEYAAVLTLLGRKRAVVVAGADGMDEASLAGQNNLVLVDKGDLLPFTLTPDDVGLKHASLHEISGGSAEENATILIDVLKGKRDAKFDVVVLNAALALFAAGRVETIQEGVHVATKCILSGKAFEKLVSLQQFSERKVGVYV